MRTLSLFVLLLTPLLLCAPAASQSTCSGCRSKLTATMENQDCYLFSYSVRAQRNGTCLEDCSGTQTMCAFYIQITATRLSQVCLDPSFQMFYSVPLVGFERMPGNGFPYNGPAIGTRPCNWAMNCGDTYRVEHYIGNNTSSVFTLDLECTPCLSAH